MKQLWRKFVCCMNVESFDVTWGIGAFFCYCWKVHKPNPYQFIDPPAKVSPFWLSCLQPWKAEKMRGCFQVHGYSPALPFNFLEFRCSRSRCPVTGLVTLVLQKGTPVPTGGPASAETDRKLLRGNNYVEGLKPSSTFPPRAQVQDSLAHVQPSGRGNMMGLRISVGNRSSSQIFAKLARLLWNHEVKVPHY